VIRKHVVSFNRLTSRTKNRMFNRMLKRIMVVLLKKDKRSIGKIRKKRKRDTIKNSNRKIMKCHTKMMDIEIYFK